MVDLTLNFVPAIRSTITWLLVRSYLSAVECNVTMRVPGEVRGGHLRGMSTTVTFVCEIVRTWNPMHHSMLSVLSIDLSYIVCERLFLTLFHITPPWPGPAFTLDWNFSKTASFSTNFSRSGSLKKLCKHIFHQITTPSRASRQAPAGYPITDHHSYAFIKSSEY